MQVDQGHEFIEAVLDDIERFLSAKVAALLRSDTTTPDSVDVPTGGLALDFSKHTDPEVTACALSCFHSTISLDAAQAAPCNVRGSIESKQPFAVNPGVIASHLRRSLC